VNEEAVYAQIIRRINTKF